MTPKRFMVIAGEPSGDVLAAELVKELRARFSRAPTYSHDLQPLQADLAPRFFGAGGPRMAEAGVELAFDLTPHALVGVVGAIKNLAKFKRLFNQLFRLAAERQPDVIICVDFSEFNHRFAHAIRQYVHNRRGPFFDWNPRIIKFVSPQVWASREGRARRMAEDFDLLLSIFPFEKNWFAARVPRFHVEFVGHPMLDRHESAASATPGAVSGSAAPSVLLLPGSRKAELYRHLPVMFDALRTIQAALPATRATMVMPSEELAGIARQSCFDRPAGLTIRTGGLTEALAGATIAIAKTGTVTMECAYFGLPAVTMYKTSLINYQVAKMMIKVKYLAMPNLLAGEEVFPEFIQDAATPANISRAALELLRDEPRRNQVRQKLAGIVATLGGPGAGRRAAEAILKIV